MSPLYSGHSVKQPPIQVTCDIMAYICTSIKQPSLYYSHQFINHYMGIHCTVNIEGKKDNSMQLLQSTAHVAHVAMCVLPTELVCTHNVSLMHSHCTYNSTSSTAMFAYVIMLQMIRHILASMSSVVGVGSCLTKYGGLCSEQHVLLERQFSPSHRVSLEWSVSVYCYIPWLIHS